MSVIKLTLSIPEDVLVQAKSYSQKTKQPLSQLVSRYFLILSQSLRSKKYLSKASLKTQRVTGIAKSSKSDDDLLFESLKDKYL